MTCSENAPAALPRCEGAAPMIGMPLLSSPRHKRLSFILVTVNKVARYYAVQFGWYHGPPSHVGAEFFCFITYRKEVVAKWQKN